MVMSDRFFAVTVSLPVYKRTGLTTVLASFYLLWIVPNAILEMDWSFAST